MESLKKEQFELVRNLDNEINCFTLTTNGIYIFGTLEYVNDTLKNSNFKKENIKQYLQNKDNQFAILIQN